MSGGTSLVMSIRGGLSEAEIETFLADATIPVRIGCRTPQDHPWIVSLWFLYRNGDIHCATSAEADVVRYLEHDGHVSFEISTNDPPYRGVRGRGMSSIAPDPEKDLIRELLERYLGRTDTPLGRRLLRDEREEVSITIDPSNLFGWDYSERMRDSDN